MSYNVKHPDDRDLAADIRITIEQSIIRKYTKKMPIRLVDTYTGLILEQSEIVSLLKMRKDYNEKLEAILGEANYFATIPASKRPSERPELHELEAFIAEYLAFAMFSHRWRDSEPSLSDVKRAKRGIYSMREKDVAEKTAGTLYFPKQTSDPSSGVKKLQEFCCLAAKCGYRWAWSDTCCIDDHNYADKSESINSMFLWYNSSDLTITYLDDVDDVKEGRLLAVDDEDMGLWFEEAEIKKPLPLSDPSTPQMRTDIYIGSLQTAPYLSLHDRLRDRTYPELQSMRPDSQVETPYLESHLLHNFSSMQECEHSGKYRKPPTWVTRGWTLQEMLASKRLRFYSKQWTLLEDAEDYESEGQVFISSFKYRTRLKDHRNHFMWGDALMKTTGIVWDDFRNFRIGTKDIKTRLLWAAKRETTKVEDKSYCLLGIFDISLPVVYGEGPRAFVRLQEELIKRTADVSLFDWCGRSSPVNSFLASTPECFEIPSLADPVIEDSSDSVFRMILNLLYAIFQTTWSGIKAAVSEVSARIRHITKSPPPGHTLVNGELNVSLFEHPVRHWELVETCDTHCCYKLEADDLHPTTVILASPAPNLRNHRTKYYLCRPWSRHTQNVFQILLELIEYVFQDTFQALWNRDDNEECCNPNIEDDEEDVPGSKLRNEMQMKRKEVIKFFEYPFLTYLIRVEDGLGVRMNTVQRVVSCYSKFDFTMPVVTRAIL